MQHWSAQTASAAFSRNDWYKNECIKQIRLNPEIKKSQLWNQLSSQHSQCQWSQNTFYYNKNYFQSFQNIATIKIKIINTNYIILIIKID